MMYLSDIREYLSEQYEAKYFVGKLGSAAENCIGIYNRDTAPQPVAIGGALNSSYARKGVKLLVRGTKNADHTERLAKEVYEICEAAAGDEIGGKSVVLVNMAQGEPVPMGADKNDVYEYVINFEVVYRK